MLAALRSAPDGEASVGSIFSLALATVRRNPGVVLLLAVAFGTVPSVLTYYLSDRLMDGQGSDFSPQTWGLLAFTLIVTSAVSILPQAVLTRAVIAESEGRRASLGECLRAAAPVLAPIMGLGIAYALATVAGLVLLIIPGVMLMTAWAVTGSVMAAERGGILETLRRSQELTRGFRWKILGLMLVFYAVVALQYMAIEMFSGERDSSNMAAAYSDPLYLMLVASTETLLVVFWSPILAALYVELRDWKDGPATGHLEEIFA